MFLKQFLYSLVIGQLHAECKYTAAICFKFIIVKKGHEKKYVGSILRIVSNYIVYAYSIDCSGNAFCRSIFSKKLLTV